MRLNKGAELVSAVYDVPLRQREKCLVFATGVVRQGLEFFFTSCRLVDVAVGVRVAVDIGVVAGAW